MWFQHASQFSDLHGTEVSELFKLQDFGAQTRLQQSRATGF